MMRTEVDDEHLRHEELPDLAHILETSNNLFGEHARRLKDELVSIIDDMVSQAAAKQARLISQYESTRESKMGPASVHNDTAPTNGKELPSPPMHSSDCILRQTTPPPCDPPDLPSVPDNSDLALLRYANDGERMETIHSREDHPVGATEQKIENSRERRSSISMKAGSRRAVFSLSQDALVDKVRMALLKPGYDVQDYYFETGYAQAIAKSAVLEYLTMLVISFNAIWIAIEFDYASDTAVPDVGFRIVEHVICVFFLAELSVRYFAFRDTKYAFQDQWFVFDSCLVLMMAFETYILNTFLLMLLPESVKVDATVLRIIRLVRLTKMARMVRLLKWMEELVTLLKGLGLATKSVMVTLLLLTVFVYVFSLVFRQVTMEHDCDTCVGTLYFKNVPSAFITLLLRGTLPDLADFVYEVADESYLLAILLMIFIFLATIIVMNMLTGILVEVVSTVSAIETETIMVKTVRQKLHDMLEVELSDEIDEKEAISNRKISQIEFESLLVKPHFAQFLQGVGVDVLGLFESSGFIFKQKELFFQEFVELILQLRGSNVATVRDLIDLRKFFSSELASKMSVAKTQIDGIGRERGDPVQDIGDVAVPESDESLHRSLAMSHFRDSSGPIPGKRRMKTRVN